MGASPVWVVSWKSHRSSGVRRGTLQYTKRGAFSETKKCVARTSPPYFSLLFLTTTKCGPPRPADPPPPAGPGSRRPGRSPHAAVGLGAAPPSSRTSLRACPQLPARRGRPHRHRGHRPRPCRPVAAASRTGWPPPGRVWPEARPPPPGGGARTGARWPGRAGMARAEAPTPHRRRPRPLAPPTPWKAAPPSSWRRPCCPPARASSGCAATATR